ncbi:MAG TPA: DNA repair protein RecO [Pyrinomonadaceae bacterium]|jgi:DNA repair protein RecO (recombination protein O)
MAIFETESLILKTYPLAEADKIVVFLTQTNGLVRGVAKGAKRLKSRFGGGLEPFSIVNATFYQKEERELVSISQIELQKSFFESASNPLFLQKFAYLAELLSEFVPPHEPNERIYRMTRICLETAAEHPEFLENVALYFEIWLLRLGGYLPSWERCDNCKRQFGASEKASLQINFHLLCENCQPVKNRNIIGADLRKIYSVAQTLSPVRFAALTEGKIEEIKEVSDILKRLITHILGKELKNDKILVAGL